LKGEGNGLIASTGVDEASEQVLMTVSDPQPPSVPADKMVPLSSQSSQQVQVVSLNEAGQARVHTSQDAIASILASMNSQSLDSEGTVHEVEELDHTTTVYQDQKPETLPLNLATSDQALQGIQTIQGIKRVNPQQNIFSTKKVIIATINGTQRILTPVSTPQFVTMKSPAAPAAPSSPRVMVDQSGNIISASPIVLKSGVGGLAGQVMTAGKSKPVVTSISSPNAALASPGGGGARNPDNKTCMWKFENGQTCGKVFTKTYNLTVHMRMHQDIRPFPCGVCEQTFRQKAHLQRHEATHGIDSTANRKKRKRPGSEEFTIVSPSIAGVGTSTDPMRQDDLDDLNGKPKAIKTEINSVDSIIEPIHRVHAKKSVSNCNVGTNTDLPMPGDDHVVDPLDEELLETVRLRNSGQRPVSKGVEQGVQYCEEDLILPESLPKRELVDHQIGEEEEIYSSHQYVTTMSAQELGDGQFQTSDGQFIDTSTNQIVMSSDGELVGFVPIEAEQQQSPVVNISTTTNEQGQQVVIIENLHHHSQDLQKEIINALMAEHNLIQLPN